MAKVSTTAKTAKTRVRLIIVAFVIVFLSDKITTSCLVELFGCSLVGMRKIPQELAIGGKQGLGFCGILIPLIGQVEGISHQPCKARVVVPRHNVVVLVHVSIIPSR